MIVRYLYQMIIFSNSSDSISKKEIRPVRYGPAPEQAEK